VIAADAHAVIYTIRERLIVHFSGGGHEVQMVIATRGCVDRHKGSYKLGQEDIPAPTESGGGTRNFVLGGTTAAYEESSTTATRYTRAGEQVSSIWRVVVRNLENGRVLHSVPTGVPSPPNPNLVGDGPTTMIVVKSDGAVAWITDTAQEVGRYQVHTVDLSGTHLRAEGSDIVPSSLALAGDLLYWTQGGNAFSVPLN